MWRARQGKNCIVHEFRPEGWTGAPMVVIQRTEGCIPRAGGKTLAGSWPGHIGAAKKAVTTHYRQQKEPENVMAARKLTLNELAARERIAELELELAKLKHQTAAPPPQPAPNRRTAVAVAAQQQNTSNWYKNQHVSGRGNVRYVDDNTYAAFVDGARIALASGRNPTAARNAAKKIVTRELSDRGVRWTARVFG